MADLREKLVELFNRKFDHYCDQCGVNKDSHYTENLADYLIANGATIQRWIPVTERLPEDELPKDSKTKRIKVFVAYKTNGRWVTRTQIRAKDYWYGDSGKWEWVKTGDPITHWMPLPEAPKEDE